MEGTNLTRKKIILFLWLWSDFFWVFLFTLTNISLSFPGGSDGKESTCNVGDLGLISELGRSSGGGHGNPLQYPCLGYGVTKSQTQLSNTAWHSISLFNLLKSLEVLSKGRCNQTIWSNKVNFIRIVYQCGLLLYMYFKTFNYKK